MEKSTGKKSEKKQPLQTLSAENKLTVFNDVMSRAALFAQLGQQYGGERDIYQALGYPKEITFDKYLARYTRQDIARAVINRPVSHTWKGVITLTETGIKETTELEKGWKALNAKLQLQNKFIRVDKLSSIGTYGALLLGFDDVKNQKGFATPVKSGTRKLLYVNSV